MKNILKTALDLRSLASHRMIFQIHTLSFIVTRSLLITLGKVCNFLQNLTNVLTGELLNIKCVFDQYFKALVLFADRYLECREESESIVQDTFVILWEKSLSFENPQALKSWLYTTVRNKALNVIKHRKILREFNQEQIQGKESEIYYMQSVIEEETRRLLFDAISQLPEQCRRVCLLNLDGLDNQKIAEVMKLSVDTVKFHKKNAYKLLREKLKHAELGTLLLVLFL